MKGEFEGLLYVSLEDAPKIFFRERLKLQKKVKKKRKEVKTAV